MEFHSTLNSTKDEKICGIAIFPLRTKVKGPARTTEEQDIVDEAINAYRPLVFIKNYMVEGIIINNRTWRCDAHLFKYFYRTLFKNNRK